GTGLWSRRRTGHAIVTASRVHTQERSARRRCRLLPVRRVVPRSRGRDRRTRSARVGGALVRAHPAGGACGRNPPRGGGRPFAWVRTTRLVPSRSSSTVPSRSVR